MSFGHTVFHRNFNFIKEVIVTEAEVCLKFNSGASKQYLDEIAKLEFRGVETSDRKEPIEIPVLFSDSTESWEAISSFTGLGREQYIEKLLECDLKVAMLGFLPGFVYLDGLPKSLQVPRKANPDRRIGANSFAIGGRYAG
ncbi:MAG: carboxyltransferase domain-containing protein, partial [Planctomycetota bacterium]